MVGRARYRWRGSSIAIPRYVILPGVVSLGHLLAQIQCVTATCSRRDDPEWRGRVQRGCHLNTSVLGCRREAELRLDLVRKGKGRHVRAMICNSQLVIPSSISCFLTSVDVKSIIVVGVV